MKVKIVVNSVEVNDGKVSEESRSQVWEGELDILREGLYITKLSILVDGEAHPIVDIPFSMDVGWWQWMPPLSEDEGDKFGSLIHSDEKRNYD